MNKYNELINSAEIVLIEFFAAWCPHCQKMMPVIKEAKGELEGRCEIYQFDIDEYQELAQENNVESIPTLILYKSGKEIWRNSGEMTLRQLVATVENNMQ